MGILNEERFRLLSEYAFINDDALLNRKDQLDTSLMEDEEEEDPFGNLDDFDDDPTSQDEPVDADNEMGDPDSEDDIPDNEMDSGEDEMGDSEVEPAVEPQPGEEPDFDNDEGETDENGDIELDVTDIVNDTQETKEASIDASAKIDQLLNNIDQLIQSSSKIDAISQRMDDIEKEIIKRNPTKDEKLELQSLHSAPYTVKLGDYWADKQDSVVDLAGEGPTFNDIDAPEEQEDETIELDPKDVESSFNSQSVKDTFDYEEEDVDDYNF